MKEFLLKEFTNLYKSYDFLKHFNSLKENVDFLIDYFINLNPLEIGLSVSSENSLDLFVKINKFKIYYNMFENEVWIEIYKDNKSHKHIVTTFENSLNEIQKII